MWSLPVFSVKHLFLMNAFSLCREAVNITNKMKIKGLIMNSKRNTLSKQRGGAVRSLKWGKKLKLKTISGTATLVHSDNSPMLCRCCKKNQCNSVQSTRCLCNNTDIWDYYTQKELPERPGFLGKNNDNAQVTLFP